MNELKSYSDVFSNVIDKMVKLRPTCQLQEFFEIDDNTLQALLELMIGNGQSAVVNNFSEKAGLFPGNKSDQQIMQELVEAVKEAQWKGMGYDGRVYVKLLHQLTRTLFDINILGKYDVDNYQYADVDFDGLFIDMLEGIIDFYVNEYDLDEHNKPFEQDIDQIYKLAEIVLGHDLPIKKGDSDHGDDDSESFAEMRGIAELLAEQLIYHVKEAGTIKDESALTLIDAIRDAFMSDVRGADEVSRLFTERLNDLK